MSRRSGSEESPTQFMAPPVYGHCAEHGLIMPSDLEHEVNDICEATDGMPPTMARRALAEAVWGVIGTLTMDDRIVTKRHVRPDHVPASPKSTINLIHNHRLRALAAGLLSTLTERGWLDIVDAQQHACLYCEVKKVNLTIDHLVPISRLGPNTKENVVGACKACNISKSDSDLVNWLGDKGFDIDGVFDRLTASRRILGWS